MTVQFQSEETYIIVLEDILLGVFFHLRRGWRKHRNRSGNGCPRRSKEIVSH